MSSSSEVLQVYRFLKACLKQICWEIKFTLITFFLFLFLSSFYQISIEEFNYKTQQALGVSYENFDLTQNQRAKLSTTYHGLCVSYGLKRDFNTDYIVLRILKDQKIKNTTIPLYEGYFNRYYFHYNRNYILLK